MTAEQHQTVIATWMIRYIGQALLTSAIIGVCFGVLGFIHSLYLSLALGSAAAVVMCALILMNGQAPEPTSAQTDTTMD